MTKHNSQSPNAEPPYIHITIHPDSGAHDDLTFRFGKNEFTTDSYFFLIDPEYERRWSNVSPRDDFIRRALTDLMSQWRNHAESLNSGSTIYLPFGLYDECSLMLRCQRKHDSFKVTSGWSNLECTSFLLSDIAPVIRDKHHAFEPSANEVTITRAKFLVSITSAIEQVTT